MLHYQDQDEIMDMLKKIEMGEITVEFVPQDGCKNPKDVYAGHVKYRCSNGYEIVVFIDGEEWDYIEAIISKDGRYYRFEDLYFLGESGYYPPDDVRKNIYKI